MNTWAIWSAQNTYTKYTYNTYLKMNILLLDWLTLLNGDFFHLHIKFTVN